MDLKNDFSLDKNFDLTGTENEWDSIMQSITNIIYYNWGDKPCNYFYGANLIRYRNKPVKRYTSNAILSDIKIALDNFEPRIAVVSMDADYSEDDRNITINFEILHNNTVRKFQISKEL